MTMPSSGSRTMAGALYGCAWVLLAAALGAGLFEPLSALLRWVPLDPNEGWNAFFADAAVRGGTLYPTHGSLIVNNYPPVSFYVVGLLGRLVGDNIFAGRYIALASMAIVVVNVYLWLRATGAGTRAAVLGAAVVATYAVTYARGYAAMNDPQWLAHALMTTGLVIVWRGKANTWALFAGAALMIAAGFTKHLLIPIPIAATWWLVRRSRAAAVIWLAFCATFLALSALLVWRLYGPIFFESLRSVRMYSVHQAVKHSLGAFKCFAPVLALSLALLPFARRRSDAEFALAYVLTAACVAVAASGGIGVDINAFFDLMIAAGLCAALTLDAVGERRLPGPLAVIGLQPALTLALCLYVACYSASLLPAVLREYHGLDALETETLTTTRLIAAEGHGHAACESPELCYWAGNPFMLDFFNYGQRLAVGKEPQTACESIFDGKGFPVVQIDPNRWGRGSAQLPASCNAVLAANYRPVRVSMLGMVLITVLGAQASQAHP